MLWIFYCLPCSAVNVNTDKNVNVNPKQLQKTHMEVHKMSKWGGLPPWRDGQTDADRQWSFIPTKTKQPPPRIYCSISKPCPPPRLSVPASAPASCISAWDSNTLQLFISCWRFITCYWCGLNKFRLSSSAYFPACHLASVDLCVSLWMSFWWNKTLWEEETPLRSFGWELTVHTGILGKQGYS